MDKESIDMALEDLDRIVQYARLEYTMPAFLQLTHSAVLMREALLKQRPQVAGCRICNDTSNSRYYENHKYNYCPHCGQRLRWEDE